MADRAPSGAVSFSSLPPEIRERLACGFSGAGHLAETARRCFEAAAGPGAPQHLLDLGFTLVRAAWEADPLRPDILDFLLKLDGEASILEPAARSAAVRAARRARPPQDGRGTAYLDRLKARGDAEKCFAFLARELKQTPEALYWARELAALAHKTGWWDRLAECFASPWPEGLDPLRNRFLGDALFVLGEFKAAFSAYRAASPVLSPPALNERLAECLHRQGERDRAPALWTSTAKARPFDANTLRRLHDVAFGRDNDRAPFPGRTAVLLYTWNKADHLDRTLASLYGSDLSGAGDARIIALDNGSTDHTPAVLDSWRERFAKDMFSIIRPPVNIGAPAARNWLMTLEETRACRFVAFLDDDVLLPPDWLFRLGAARRAFPEAGVWGCKVADAGAPSRIQHADINLLPPVRAKEADLAPETATFGVHRPQDEAPDLGRFDAVCPCASVTGCCHVFATETLLAAGEFDLQFSPSQFDDFDHDLTLAEMGRPAVCQGGLTVLHAKSSGLGEGLSGSAAGNLHKLYKKRSRAQMDALRAQLAETIVRDLETKRVLLEEDGFL